MGNVSRRRNMKCSSPEHVIVQSYDTVGIVRKKLVKQIVSQIIEDNSVMGEKAQSHYIVQRYHINYKMNYLVFISILKQKVIIGMGTLMYITNKVIVHICFSYNVILQESTQSGCIIMEYYNVYISYNMRFRFYYKSTPPLQSFLNMLRYFLASQKCLAIRLNISFYHLSFFYIIELLSITYFLKMRKKGIYLVFEKKVKQVTKNDFSILLSMIH